MGKYVGKYQNPLETRMKSSYVAEQAGFEPAEGY